jgi:polyvinyl alcohol dehydrogenase (cytochrome)
VRPITIENTGSLLLLLFIGCAAAAADQAAPQGEAVYQAACAGCHETTELTRAPPRDSLESLPPETVLAALETGVMTSQGFIMSREERIAVAEYLGGGKIADTGDNVFLPPSGYCEDRGAPPDFSDARSAWRVWGADVQNSRFRDAAASGLTARNVPRLKLKWAFAFPRSTMASSHPAYVDGRLFVGSATGVVYSLNADSGCIYWSHRAPAGIRAGIVIGNVKRGSEVTPVVFFGDLQGNVSAVDAGSGELLWRVRPEDHPQTRITGTPQFDRGRLYVPISSLEEVAAMNPDYECCTFRGSVAALDGATGQTIWKTYTITQEPRVTGTNKIGRVSHGPSGASVWCAPTIDEARSLLYVGTGDNYTSPATLTSDAIMALDLATGQMKWARQMLAGDVYNTSCDITPDEANCPVERGPDYDFAAPPILRRTANGKSVLLAGQKSGIVYGLDPDQAGAILWQTRVSPGGVIGGIQWGMAADDEAVYTSISGWEPTDPLKGGGLHALRIDSGEPLWSADAPQPRCLDHPGCSRAQPQAVNVIPGVVFSGSLDGHLRANSTADGALIWDFDTVRDYETVNGVAGSGGSLNGSGAVVADGMLFINSGYYVGMRGNVLLAFSIEK